MDGPRLAPDCECRRLPDAPVLPPVFPHPPASTGSGSLLDRHLELGLAQQARSLESWTVAGACHDPPWKHGTHRSWVDAPLAAELARLGTLRI
jgi:hypothetical protein